MRIRPILLTTVVAVVAMFFVGCGGESTTEQTPAATVVVDGNPDSIDSPWQLTGPDSYSHDGQGDETLSDLAPGEYTLTWGAVAGWNLPDPSSQTQTVADGGSVTFSGTYTQDPQLATIAVDVKPDSANASWQLTGPDGYSEDGTSDMTLLSLSPGDYTVTWGAASGYDTPSSETKAASGGATTTFEGIYLLPVGTGALDISNVNSSYNGFVRVADDPGLEPQVFTIEAWVTPQGAGYAASDALGAVLIGKQAEGALGQNLGSWALTWSPVDQTVLFGVVHEFNTASAVTIAAPEDSAPLDSNVHVAATFDGDNLSLYVNGTLEATGAYPYADVYYGDEDVLMGAANFGGGYFRGFDGVIDELRLWDHARSGGDIAAGMNCRLTGDETGLLAYWSFEAGDLTDDSGNGHDGVIQETLNIVSFVTPEVSLPGCPPE